MQKEMSRKEFLIVLALGIGSILGFSSIIRLLTGESLDRRLKLGQNADEYGEMFYGGGHE